MLSRRHFGLYVLIAGLIACVSSGLALDLRLPMTNPLTPPQVVYHLTLEEAMQRAITTNKGLALANLDIHANREATAAARAEWFCPRKLLRIMRRSSEERI